MSKRFQVIVADCAWSFSDRLSMSSVKRGAESNYAVMSNEDILSLRIKDIADPNGCVLALWVPSSLLKLGMSVMENWGFECKSTYVWVKTKKEPLAQVSSAIQNASKSPSVKSLKEIISSIVQHTKLGDMLGFGMGRLFRQSHEICLIGINNNKIYRSLENKSQRSVCMAPNEGHSIKPEALHDSLELMFPNAEKIELFARREKAGWTTLGNEIDGRDIRDAIEDLINAA